MRKPTIQNILVPIDFSTLSIEAIETAKQLARRSGANIHLVHVHQVDYPAPSGRLVFSAGASRKSFEGQWIGQLTKQLKAIASKTRLSPGDQTHVRTGISPFHEICRLAQEIPADLIVVPTHGRTGLKHVLVGSTAERIVQHSPCPVFVVRQRKRVPKDARLATPDTILAPVDFSNCSREGLNYAIGLAREFGARLILLHATYLGYVYCTEGTAIYDVPALQEAARKRAELQLQKLVRDAKVGRVQFETVLTEGSPLMDICAFAKDHDVDLIITSTHGLTGLKHVLIGSIAEQVVRHAPCSVLVVPSHPQIRLASLPKPDGRKARQIITRRELRTAAVSKKDRKLTAHAFPERRKTNKFRESHIRG